MTDSNATSGETTDWHRHLSAAHDLWTAAIHQELDHLRKRATASVSDVSDCINELAQSPVLHDDTLAVPRGRIFKLVQTLQFEDRIQQEIDAIANTVGLLNELVRTSGAVEMSESGGSDLDDVAETLVARLRACVGLAESRARIEKTIRGTDELPPEEEPVAVEDDDDDCMLFG